MHKEYLILKKIPKCSISSFDLLKNFFIEVKNKFCFTKNIHSVKGRIITSIAKKFNLKEVDKTHFTLW